MKNNNKIALISRDNKALSLLDRVLSEEGYNVVSQSASIDQALKEEPLFRPDIIVLNVSIPDGSTLQYLHLINKETPLPIVMFTNESSTEVIAEVVSAGVSAYVVDGLQENRIASIVETARLRFIEQQNLRTELAETQTELANRKLIERAKGLIMEQRKCTEDIAFQSMRKAAMNNNKCLVDIAQDIISANEILTGSMH